MPVTNTHREYQAYEAVWKKCTDAADGSRAVKAARELYLPRLSGQDASPKGNQAYDAYLTRSMYFNGTGRTVEALAGAVTRKPMATEGIPSSIEAHLKDVTLTDTSLDAMATEILTYVVNPGRFGVLLDLPETASPTARPYWVPYKADEIVNWREEVIDGDATLVLLVLREGYEQSKGPVGDDRFDVGTVTRYRVCELLTPSGAAGNAEPEPVEGQPLPARTCYQSIYEEEKDQSGKGTGNWVVVKGPIQLLRRGAGVPFIPFVFFGPAGIDACVVKPPVEDLIDVNLGHYRNSADYEWGLHYVGIPTPWVSGYEGSGELTLGPTRAWTLADPQAKCGMLEFTGTGLGQILSAMVEKRSLMAALGGRLLEAQKVAVEAAETVRLRQSGEGSVLSKIANAVSLGLSKLVQWHAFLAGVEQGTADKATVRLNTDFASLTVSADTLKVLMLALQDNRISFETWYAALEESEIARPGIDAEEELEDIEADTLRAQGAAMVASLAVGSQVTIAPGMERDPAHAGVTFTVASVQNGTYVLRAPDGSAVSGYTAEDLVPMPVAAPTPGGPPAKKPEPKPKAA